MPTDLIFSKVAGLIAANANVDPDKITMDSNFADLGMDSLDGLELINDLEDAFKVSIPNEEVLKIKSVRQAVESLQRVVVAVAQ
ncbi:acyl carrier protein [Terrimonas pollutisoli]|uniref:acyl carrier protein n=1 Tax=Terrimonas pollutisoli TaxID=3034147 RepID=UPI0023EC025C|nr:acyl carrier protein [Terrimonas sp. H1YJ31]